MSDKIITEGEYSFDFSESLNAYKADNKTRAGLKSVDFIVETEKTFLFIEVKNVDNKSTPKEQTKQWLEKLKSNKKSFLSDMGVKFKDTLLYHFAMEKYFEKPIRYIIILQFDIFDSKQRGKLKEDLHAFLPMDLRNTEYTRKIKIEKYDIIDIKQWNENKDYSMYPITQID
ncbi:hypothetical protein [Clostridium tagluense]|uniref:hypothetical protein n=2 Tax=Clostridium TaxID=1485 RepID=UPI001C6EECF8|nr:hypothetical protein [Clostridium tagluense]MBW9159004.1 hypothetical protein [Clostridium tagluense]WLC68393.1 hypothetical protein KTC93_24980 [Clostridium tagluense]